MSRDGTFQIADLPPGRYELTPEFSADAPFSAKPPGAIEVKPGASIRPWRSRLQRIPLITGRVVDETTGQGIAGVSLRAYHVASDNNLLHWQSGQDGCFGQLQGRGRARHGDDPARRPSHDPHGHGHAKRAPSTRSRPTGPGRT